MGLSVLDDVRIAGHFHLRLFDAETGELVGEREADNLVVTSGLTLLAQAINWLFVQNYNTSWGSPYSPLTNLGDIYGAAGTSSTAAAAGQTALLAEIGRALVSSGAISGAQLIYDFFLGIAQANGTIAELGLFMQGGLVQTTLTTALTSGNNYTSLSVSALPADIPSGSTVVIGYGSGQTQSVITTSDSPLNATSIAIGGGFNANANYPSGTPVAYIPGTMLDRSVITPITKTPSETGVLEVTLTLASG